MMMMMDNVESKRVELKSDNSTQEQTARNLDFEQTRKIGIHAFKQGWEENTGVKLQVFSLAHHRGDSELPGLILNYFPS